MRTKYLLLSVAAILSLLAAASCTKELAGRKIRISASTRPEGLMTKTLYSGDVVGGRERIDWADGDEIVLAMKNSDGSAQQVYAVNDISIAGVNSKTGLEPSGSSNGLEWGTGTHDFWAGYPSSVTVGDHTISSVIPANQVAVFDKKQNDVLLYKPDMSLAFMVAGLQDTPTDAGINLDFYPGITTFDFTVGSNAEVAIDKFVIETEAYEAETSAVVPICGTAVATFDPSAGMAYSFSTAGSPAPGQTIELTFSDGTSTYRPIISTSTSMNFKVFALPQALTGIRITFHFSNGVSKSLRLKQNDSWVSFPAAVKANISGLLVPGATWYINFDYPREEQWVVHPDIEIGVE